MGSPGVHSETLSIKQKKGSKKGQHDGSVGKGTCHTNLWPEFDPRIQVTGEGQNQLHKVVL